MSARRPPTRPSGYTATGPGFYVWEPTRTEATRAARDLSVGREPVKVRPAGSSLRPGRVPRRP